MWEGVEMMPNHSAFYEDAPLPLSLSTMSPSCLTQGLGCIGNALKDLRQLKAGDLGEKGVRNRKHIFQMW